MINLVAKSAAGTLSGNSPVEKAIAPMMTGGMRRMKLPRAAENDKY